MQENFDQRQRELMTAREINVDETCQHVCEIKESYEKMYILPHKSHGTQVLVRARVHRIRNQAKIFFLVLRDEMHTIQCIYLKNNPNKHVLEHLNNLTHESIVDVTGIVKEAKPIVKSCTINNVELEIVDINVISVSEPMLPIQVDEHIYLSKTKSDETERESKLNTRLNHRVIDLRRNDNQFIFRLQSKISSVMRHYLEINDFVEIHTPKIIGTASEGGANVFELRYFEKDAYLAQSPQFYKQMAVLADFPKVYEVGPVFRAEKSFTHRHLTEFTGFDLEMTFETDYHEILDFFDGFFVNLFTHLSSCEFSNRIFQFWSDYEIEPLSFRVPSIRITFKEAVALLRENGFTMGDFEDFNTEKEKALGKIMKEKYSTDFFIVDQFPTSVRPFYTMPNPADPLYSNSYDFFLRGEEILSGAQRISDAKMLLESVKTHKINPMEVADYLNSFRYGAPLHGGGGIGLERLLMFYLGINNIRNVSLFPRDPTRVSP